MGKKRKKRRSRDFETRQQQRKASDFSHIMSDVLLRSFMQNELFPDDPHINIRDTVQDDLRRYHPERLPVFRTESGRSVRYRVDGRFAKQSQLGKVYFDQNRKLDQVTTCKKRRERRQTLFRRRKIGKGIAGPKIRNYTDKSKVRCD